MHALPFRSVPEKNLPAVVSCLSLLSDNDLLKRELLKRMYYSDVQITDFV